MAIVLVLLVFFSHASATEIGESQCICKCVGNLLQVWLEIVDCPTIQKLRNRSTHLDTFTQTLTKKIFYELLHQETVNSRSSDLLKPKRVNRFLIGSCLVNKEIRPIMMCHRYKSRSTELPATAVNLPAGACFFFFQIFFLVFVL